MRLDFAVIALSLLTGASAAAVSDPRDVHLPHDLFKRKGGGGGGGRGGGGSVSSGSRGGSSSSSSSSSSSGRGGSSGSSGGTRAPSNTAPKANTGGTSLGGTGPQPRFGGGAFYGGGASVPYSAGRRSRGGLVPGLLIGSALAFWPALWLSGAYMYNFNSPYRFYNQSAARDEELPVVCGCAQYAACGCDENEGSKATLDELVGNGSYDGLNRSLVTVGSRDGRKVLLINGTLPNGTTARGSEDRDAEGNLTSAAASMVMETLGYWPLVATVASIIVFSSV